MMTSNAADTTLPAQSLGKRHKLMLTVFAFCSLFFLILMFKAAIGDLVAGRARWQVSEWQINPKAKLEASQLGWTRNAFIKSLSWMPDDGNTYESLGYIYGVRATMARAIVPELADAMLDEAVFFFRQAIERRPMSPYAWASLAQALNMRGSDDKLMWSAWNKAWDYGRNEISVQLLLADIIFSRWDGDTLTDEQRDLAKQWALNAPDGRAKKRFFALLNAHALAEQLLPFDTWAKIETETAPAESVGTSESAEGSSPVATPTPDTKAVTN